MPFKSFDKPAARSLREKLEAHLKSFEAEHGVSISLGNAKFDRSKVRFVGVEVVVPELAEASNRQMLAMRMVMAGITAPGTEPKFESDEYILTDFRPKAYKRPWVAKSKYDGKSYVLDDRSAKRHFGTAS